MIVRPFLPVTILVTHDDDDDGDSGSEFTPQPGAINLASVMLYYADPLGEEITRVFMVDGYWFRIRMPWREFQRHLDGHHAGLIGN